MDLQGQDGIHHEPVRVMLVDDELAFRDTLAKVLTRRGFHVQVASSGEECLELLSASDVDVVVLDLLMPGIGGMATLRRIPDIRPKAQVIMLSGHGTLAAGIEAMKARAFDFLSKPVMVDELIKVIHLAAEARDHEKA